MIKMINVMLRVILIMPSMVIMILIRTAVLMLIMTVVA